MEGSHVQANLLILGGTRGAGVIQYVRGLLRRAIVVGAVTTIAACSGALGGSRSGSSVVTNGTNLHRNDRPTVFRVASMDKRDSTMLSPADKELIAAVLRASIPEQRSRLMAVVEPPNRRFHVDLFFAPPSGIVPGVGTRIIGSCNGYFLNGEVIAAPGDGSGCSTWRPTLVDRLVQHAIAR